MLTPDEVIETARDLWSRHRDEVAAHDRVYDYVRGHRGRPEVPDGAGDELEDISRMAVKNVLSLVRDAFSQPLSVVGFRSPEESENAAAWELWQRHRLDARQGEPIRSAITYGTSYAIVTDSVRFRSPRQLIAVYEDPHVDLWPVYALETWIDDTGKKPARLGMLYDETHQYPVHLGNLPRIRGTQAEKDLARSSLAASVRPIYHESEAEEHGSDNCPVVRFVNARDAERLVVGEIEPLIEQQRAINTVNFDRLVVSRFGAFPQRYAIGWAADSASDLVRVSMSRLMSFEDDTVKVGSFAAATVDPYNSILGEMLRHVAMTAQIPPLTLTGDIENIAAEAAAMIEAPYQRKLRNKQESFGESFEQMLRLMAAREGIEVSDEAEAIWAETESRAYGAVVDGITKLASAGVPLEQLVDDVPGWTQQRADAARKAIRRGSGTSSALEALRSVSGVESAGDAPADIKAKADAMGVLIRAGVDPKDAAEKVGLGELDFTGAVPTSLRLPEGAATKLED